MNTRAKWWCLALALTLYFRGTALGQEKAQNETFRINGDPEEVRVLQIEGHEYIDIRDLARITNGFLSFQDTCVVLTFPTPDAEPIAVAQTNSMPEGQLSKDFMRAGIEAVAAMREWRSTLALVIRNGYPVGNEMVPYRGKALDKLTLASAAATTPSDESALQLLSNEFQNLSTWSKNLVTARNSASAAEYAMSDDAFNDDDLFQKIVHCGKFLGPMLASGNFGDNAACH